MPYSTLSDQFHSNAIVNSPEGRVFEVSPEVLTIERKTIKRSSKLTTGISCLTDNENMAVQYANLSQMLSNRHLVLDESYTPFLNTVSGPESRM